MYSLNPNPLLLFQKKRQCEIMPNVLDDAAVIAKDALRDAPRSSHAEFQSQAIGLVFGAIIPLVGNAVFGWPTYLVILGIAADNLALWLGDLLKPLLASDEFSSQWKEKCDLTDAVAIARAIEAHPRQVDASGIPIYRALEPTNKPLDGYWQVGFLIALLPLSWGSLFYPNAAAEASRMQTFIVLAIPSAVRLIFSLISIARNLNSGKSTATLMPQGSTQLFAFLAAVFAFVMGNLVFADDHTGLGRYDGPVFFAIYLICLIAFTLVGVARTNDTERVLKKFVSTDFDALKSRLVKNPARLPQ